jgi:hypothetical protein
MSEQVKNGLIFLLLIAVIVLSVLLYNEKKCSSTTSSRCRYGDTSMCLPNEIYNVVKTQCNN